ncbi:nodulation protein NodL [Sinorhizobium sp. BJ1]|nr:nodulation protein NodL [Sinorhizobium sp. BJ1]
MDVNSINPSNASPRPGSPPAANERAFADQLSGFQYSPRPRAADSLVPQGEAYSPYLDTGHPYSQYLDSANPYPSSFDWQDDLYTRSTASPAPLVAGRERSPQPSEQQPITTRTLQDVPEYDQDLIWQHAAEPQAADSLVPQGEAYLDTGHPYSQYFSANPYPSSFDWQERLYTQSTASPAPLVADRERSPQPNEQQPLARTLQDVPEYDEDLIWQHAAEPQAGPSQSGPSQAGPSSSTGAAPAELKDFVMNCGFRAWDHWLLAPHTASEDQMNMLRANGLMPTAEVPTTTFLMMGVPHTAEFRQEGHIRIRPSFDSGL